jgi:hypothetical protein
MSAPSLVFIGDVHNHVEMLGRALAAVPDGATLAFVGDLVNMRRGWNRKMCSTCTRP